MKATKPQQQHQHHKGLPGGGERPWKRPGPGMRTWLLRVVTSVLVWSALVQLMSVMELWHTGMLAYRPPWPSAACLDRRHGGSNATAASLSVREETGGDSARGAALAPPALLPRRVYKNNGYLRISCNGGLNQMRAAICDMVTIARYLNLTLLVPELDKTSFWADSRYGTLVIQECKSSSIPSQNVLFIICLYSDFQDIFDVKHFINSLRDEVRVVKSLPVKYNRKALYSLFSMPPVSWSSDKYYFEEILPLFRKHKIIHFNKTDARLANNGLPLDLQSLRCRVNYEALHFAPGIQALGDKLISMLKQGGSFVVLHLRYEMDMLSFSGCTHGCSDKEADELTRMRYMYPWWKEKEIVSDVKRLDGFCPLTPEETTLVLQALGFSHDTQIYIAAGEIYGGERRLSTLRAAFPKIVKKEMLLSPDELRPYLNHSTQMAALDYIVSVASDVFIPTYDGNMAKVVEGHRRYLGFRKTVTLNRKALVRLLDMHQNGTMSWEEFALEVKDVHKHRMGGPTRRLIIPDRPKEEDYFYANPQECLGPLDLETRSELVDI